MTNIINFDKMKDMDLDEIKEVFHELSYEQLEKEFKRLVEIINWEPEFSEENRISGCKELQFRGNTIITQYRVCKVLLEMMAGKIRGHGQNNTTERDKSKELILKADRKVKSIMENVGDSPEMIKAVMKDKPILNKDRMKLLNDKLKKKE